MKDVFICDAVRTPIGRFGGTLSSIRADDLAALPLKALMERNPQCDFSKVDDVILGCANQAGEDNRNIARMATLLAGIPVEVPATTLNRLCGSGLNAVGIAMQAIRSGEADLILAGGAESMTRAPFVMGKSESPFARNQEMFDTTMGWRFINKKLDKTYGTETMPKTAENLAEEFGISRIDQDNFSAWSQEKTASAQEMGLFNDEIIAVEIPQKKQDALIFSTDEHPRLSTTEKLAKLKPFVKTDGTITAGNASGINDGAAALLIASKEAADQNGLTPIAKILGMTVTGVPPRIMGIGPVPATKKLLKRLNLSLDDMDIIELNEAFAAQALACSRELGLKDDDPRINPQGGAIALGHPLGMSGARLVTTAMYQLKRTGKKYALCTMCIGVGQGIAMVIENVSN
ncbi:3-oxoadipyl-CoA thiolase [Pseudoalteromonas denitrificans]|uniref:Beta-ketoadipyl-CoA thiolase n=1 Tax=Pseudoalteromonas denitrificans DSM 6059 TaxID=1123010 RepID=A0A1I1H0W8_9GAMM|nr:3-oxoadipyl-CoA thiolase [Pseudoalteromonas denitrificans]SFC17172.1 acetyl-CoA acyltransferase [Pseudoalteromonas denitrificans DSM 6059]